MIGSDHKHSSPKQTDWFRQSSLRRGFLLRECLVCSKLIATERRNDSSFFHEGMSLSLRTNGQSSSVRDGCVSGMRGLRNTSAHTEIGLLPMSTNISASAIGSTVTTLLGSGQGAVFHAIQLLIGLDQFPDTDHHDGAYPDGVS